MRREVSIFRALALSGVSAQDREVLEAFGDLLLLGLYERTGRPCPPGHIVALDLRGAAEDLRATAADLRETLNAYEPRNETERKLFAPFPRYIRRLKALAAEMERSAEV